MKTFSKSFPALIILFGLLAFSFHTPVREIGEKSNNKVRVFVMAGQSNMEGYGAIEDPENYTGTLVDLIRNDEDGCWSELEEAGEWNSLEGVLLYFARNEDTIRSNVSVGQGAWPDLIGPELMFAHELEEYYDDPVLIIKTAWGGKNLAVDFRPPSAGGTTGKYYKEMIRTIREVTANLDAEFPEIGTSDFEISGFAWFQGWNDGESDAYLHEYESNLHHLLNDVRNDLGNPDLPAVIASSGHGGYQEDGGDPWVRGLQTIISVAQENVACNDSIYGGTVGFVDTKAFYRERSESPEDAIHHFHMNALTFLEIGQAMGSEMIKTMNDMAFCYGACKGKLHPTESIR